LCLEPADTGSRHRADASGYCAGPPPLTGDTLLSTRFVNALLGLYPAGGSGQYALPAAFTALHTLDQPEIALYTPRFPCALVPGHTGNLRIDPGVVLCTILGSLGIGGPVCRIGSDVLVAGCIEFARCGSAQIARAIACMGTWGHNAVAL